MSGHIDQQRREAEEIRPDKPAAAQTVFFARPDLAAAIRQPTIVISMGVSGSGKTTVGALVAHTLGWNFQEGDDLHPAANIEKMSHGIPLNDDDRAPWLAKIAEVIDGWRRAGQSGVVTCSALKRAYRDKIVTDPQEVKIAYLRGTRDTIGRRMAARHEHFMPVALLDSQFATLEEPQPDEHPIVLSIDQPAGAIATILIRKLAELRPA
jgi:carbohydrate kinase (thermoresistant glucokinase family)